MSIFFTYKWSPSGLSFWSYSGKLFFKEEGNQLIAPYILSNMISNFESSTNTTFTDWMLLGQKIIAFSDKMKLSAMQMKLFAAEMNPFEMKLLDLKKGT